MQRGARRRPGDPDDDAGRRPGRPAGHAPRPPTSSSTPSVRSTTPTSRCWSSRRRLQPRHRRRGLRRHGRAGRDHAASRIESDDRCGGARAGRRGRGLGRRSWRTPSREGWSGIEGLSGIPGLTGATPIQNVGAYGQDVSQTVAQVRAWDRREQEVRTFANADCGFTYRHSRFKARPARYVVLDVRLPAARRRRSPRRSAYADLARALGVELGARVPLAEARAAVLEQRRRRGMVLDPADHDTW